MATSATAEKQSFNQNRHTAHSITLSPTLIKNIWKSIEVTGFTIGPAILAFNLFNFNLSKLGFFYKDPAQYGIAGGVFLIAAAIITHKQKS
ncbi:MAG: hypothetical protein BMS9Abin33_0736 [Gammaproteobacteria bacterium]|nr:MAG: hypothetical protein BMS9Abin33_0736 [Gammaproteobacteria bacterium]